MDALIVRNRILVGCLYMSLEVLPAVRHRERFVAMGPRSIP
jgi:hypothetical protein